MLSDWQYRAWHTLLCFASKHGGEFTDDLEVLSFVLRKPPAKVRDTMQVLLSAKLFDKTERGYRPHDWDEAQYKSDSPNQRVAAFRDRKRNVTCNVTVTADVTPPEADTEADTDTEKKVEGAPADASASKLRAIRGTRWPSDQEIPADWFPWVEERFRELGRAPPSLRVEATKFTAYWASETGAKASKLDWKKTFLNWCLNARPDRNTAKSSQFDELAAGARRAAGLDDGQRQGMETVPDNLIRLAISHGNGGRSTG